ncbi:unnamed protein product [Sphagnum compactum]
MLLASQGGFEVKTAIADAGVPSCLFLEMFMRAMVNMAKWSDTFVNGPASGGSLGAGTQAAANVAVLNISEVLDRQSMGIRLKDALPILGHMLAESENLEEIGAAVGGLQALGLSLSIEPDIALAKGGDQAQHE